MDIIFISAYQKINKSNLDHAARQRSMSLAEIVEPEVNLFLIACIFQFQSE